MDAHDKMMQDLETIIVKINSRNEQSARIALILADFYRSPLSMSSVQPILDLAVEMNPGLNNEYVMPLPAAPLTKETR